MKPSSSTPAPEPGTNHLTAKVRKSSDNRNFSGRGKAKLNPSDQNVAVIREEIAIARALSDLSHKLLHSAAVGVETMTHEKARLHR
jgi:Rv2632c-like